MISIFYSKEAYYSNILDPKTTRRFSITWEIKNKLTKITNFRNFSILELENFSLENPKITMPPPEPIVKYKR